MSAEKETLESIFRNALEHAEMPVDPAIWQGVSAGIGGAAGGAAGGGISLFAKVAIGVVAAGGVTTAAVFLTSEEGPSEPEQTTSTFMTEPAEEDSAPVDSIDWKDVASEPVPESPVEEDFSEVSSLAEPEQEDAKTPTSPEQDPLSSLTEGSEQAQPQVEQVADDEPQIEPSYAMDRGGTPTDEVIPEPIQPDDLLRAEFTTSAVDKTEMQYRFAAAYDQAELYLWQVDEEYVGNRADLVYIFKEEGDHDISLTVQDASGQKKDHRIVFTVERPSSCIPEIPNVFTPNNDGFNDFLDIEELSIDCEIVEFRVYDVLGALVFEASETVKTWDGIDPYGNACPVGIYRVEYVLSGNDGKSHPGQQYVNLK